jgi:hypothetical protein
MTPALRAWVERTSRLSAMKKRNWKLLNTANGRLEPVQDFKAALRAFVGSDVNLIMESVGAYEQ